MDVLTTAELCRLFGVTRQRISQLAAERRVKPHRPAYGNRGALWRRGDLERLRPLPNGRPRPPRP